MVNNTQKLFRLFAVNFNRKYTIRQISIETTIPYMTLNRIVKKLQNERLLDTENVGNSVLCSLNIKNPLTKQHLILASDSYKEDFLRNKPLLKKISRIAKNEVSLILFGSYASGKEKKHSDIDLALISDKDIKNEFDAIEKLYDIEINLMVFKQKQFLAMLKSDQENVGKQILKNHVILYNPEQFWNIVYEAL